MGISNQDRKRRSERQNIIKREKETRSLKNFKNKLAESKEGKKFKYTL